MRKSLFVVFILLFLIPAFSAVYAAEDADRSDKISVYLDGYLLDRGVDPVIRDGYTLVPIRPIAEAMGADVKWDEASKTATLVRASKEIKLTIGQLAAYVNGVEISLNMGPALIDGRTMLPLRFVAEQFSQIVEYNAEKREIYIDEDRSIDADGVFEKLMLGCGAILAKRNNLDPYQIGMAHRAWGYSTEYENASSMAGSASQPTGSPRSKTRARQLLSGSWSCDSREELIETIKRMTLEGHNDNFLFDYSIVRSLSEQQYSELLSKATGMDAYMWPLVKRLGEKWGNFGIAAWDWFRMTHLAGWGYNAGYLEFSEAYNLAAPSIFLLRQSFSSWDEAVENYMDGYAYWARIDLSNSSSEYHARLQVYESLKANQLTDGLLFDPSVWD